MDAHDSHTGSHDHSHSSPHDHSHMTINSKQFHIDIDKHTHSDHVIKFGGCLGKSICIDGSIKHSTQTVGELKVFKSVSSVQDHTPVLHHTSFIHDQHHHTISLTSPQYTTLNTNPSHHISL
jgi:hypothetical protein